MARINSNVPAITAVRHLHRNYDDLNIRLQRLATGLRINRGADDPAGLIASERMGVEVRTIQQAIENSTRADNVLSVAEGALNEVSALLLDLQALLVEAANQDGLLEEELRANQQEIDSILDSLDRIAQTTTFAGEKLLDGTRSYVTSGVPPAAIASLELFAAYLPQGGSQEVTVSVTQSAETAQVVFTGSNTSGVSTTSATTIELRGDLGPSLLTFASGTTLSEIRTAINAVSLTTGVSAVISTAGIAGVASSLVLNSTGVGVDAFVSVAPISGSFVVTGNSGTVIRDDGVEAGVLLNGQEASVNGLRADVRSGELDARVYLSRAFAQTLSSASFTITGGGALFQLTPEITPNGQVKLGFNSVSTTYLGNAVTGLLYTLRSGNDNDLASGNLSVGQAIVEEAVDQVSSFRGRLGNLQRNQIEPNINSQRVALENVTAARSLIRDADMAEEVSRLTRAQVLVQSTQSTLQIANSVPTMVLSLLK